MAQLLVIKIDKHNLNDPFKDVLCYKRGDIVTVVEDDHEWSNSEQNGIFEIISVTGLAEDYAHLTYMEEETIDDRIPKSMQAIRSMRRKAHDARDIIFLIKRRRMRRIDLDNPARPLIDKRIP